MVLEKECQRVPAGQCSPGEEIKEEKNCLCEGSKKIYCRFNYLYTFQLFKANKSWDFGQ